MKENLIFIKQNKLLTTFILIITSIIGFFLGYSTVDLNSDTYAKKFTYNENYDLQNK